MTPRALGDLELPCCSSLPGWLTSRRSVRLARTAGAVVLLTLGVASGASARVSPGTVEGVARVEQTGEAIPFALVRLLPVDSQAVVLQQGITSASGRFRFAGVADGDYRLQLLRIGYRPVLSPELQVRAGETLRHDLHGPAQAVRLATVTVRGDDRCLDGATLADDPELAALWTEAREGVEIRRAFELRYRFTRLWQKHYHLRLALRSDRRWTEVDTLVLEPDSVLARERQRRAGGRVDSRRVAASAVFTFGYEQFEELRPR